VLEDDPGYYQGRELSFTSIARTKPNCKDVYPLGRTALVTKKVWVHERKVITCLEISLNENFH